MVYENFIKREIENNPAVGYPQTEDLCKLAEDIEEKLLHRYST